VLDLGLSTTPTVEYAVAEEGAQAGIILTASHNPKQWNALKLLNEKGEFISATDGQELLEMIADQTYDYVDVDNLGIVTEDDTWIERHIEAILSMEGVDVESIRSAELKVVCDCVNSTGGISIPVILKKLGVNEVIELYCEPNGIFPHNPEPLKENLSEIAEKVVSEGAHLGVVVDPDVDRLALICEDGSMFGEEYTLVAVADHVLSYDAGPTVSNLSSSRALRDVTESHGQTHYASAVGEVNVVALMKEVGATIGGEGNGGIIDPSLHYGRDALLGVALFLTHYVKKGMKMTALKSTYPQYFMSKNKIQLTQDIDVDEILSQMRDNYSHEEVSTIDGVKIDFEDEWVHLRKSNTEPIIRIYSESTSQAKADALAERVMNEIRQVVA
ncbi:MAG: phosphoglucosamine mutase, partial [Flavobacteriales bacterium]|nr:phosphoglucosamine mutase [Flavobacteriales bacterium]